MKKLLTLTIVAALIGTQITISAAERMPQTVSLISNDNKQFNVPVEVARLSKTIQTQIEKGQAEKPIHLQHINGGTLKNLLLLMQLAYQAKPKPLKDRIETIGAQISVMMNSAELKTWENLIRIIDNLDIKVLIAPLADSLIKHLYAMHNGDRELIESIVLSSNVSDEWKGRLAKIWYLNFGKDKNFILQDLNYGFSLEQLVAYNKIPPVDELGMLDLSGLRINNLRGLHLIPEVAETQMLFLSDNKIATVPEKIFDSCPHLKIIELDNNQIARLPHDIFLRHTLLEIIGLNDNKIEELPPDIFANLVRLGALGLANNRLTNVPVKIFNKNLYSHLYLVNLSGNPLAPAFKKKLEPFKKIVTF